MSRSKGIYDVEMNLIRNRGVNATMIEMTTEAQNGTFPNKITTSSVKSPLWKKE